VFTPVIDWLLTQDGVDPDALVLFGRSFAGYLAPRAATADHRFAALICDPAQYDFGAAIRARLGEPNWERLQNDDPTLDTDLAPMLADPSARNGFEWRMVAHGVTTMTDYLRELCRYNLVALADRITCPTLALAGEGDFAGTGQLQTFADSLVAPVTTHAFTVADRHASRSARLARASGTTAARGTVGRGTFRVYRPGDLRPGTAAPAYVCAVQKGPR
jgi:hypothetical protein